MKYYILIISIFIFVNTVLAQDSKPTGKTDGKYTGANKKGKKHGQGTFLWNNGSKYIGNWKTGLMHGFGIYTSASGNRYRGEWRNGLMHGNGIYTWSNGIQYDGYFRYGKREGSGKLSFPDGSFHEGQWKNGMGNGYGKHVWASGSQYIGDWKDDKRHGRGVMIYKDGKIEQGMWVDDKYVICECKKEFLPVKEAFDLSDAVFVGKVIEIDDSYGYDIVKMEVKNYWKGELSYSRTITVTAGYTSCDQIYLMGESYLVFSRRNETGYGYYADKCNRTNMLQNASRDIELLKEQIPCKIKIPKGAYLTGENDPVCGCDGKKYKNPSAARKAGVPYWTAGDCDN